MQIRVRCSSMAVTVANSPTRRNRMQFTGKLDGRLLVDWVFGQRHCTEFRRHPARSGLRVYGILTPRIEVRDAAFRAGIIMTSDDPFPRLGMAIGVTGNVQLLGKMLTTSNMGYLTGQHGMIACLEPGSRWCNISFDWDLIRLTAEAHDYVIPDSDHSCSMPSYPQCFEEPAFAGRPRVLQYARCCRRGTGRPNSPVLLRALNSGSKPRKMQRGRQWRTVHRGVDFILEEYSNPITVTDLCRLAGVSERNLEYLFRSATGLTMQQYRTKPSAAPGQAMLMKGEYEQSQRCGDSLWHPHAGVFPSTTSVCLGNYLETLLLIVLVRYHPGSGSDKLTP